MECLGCYTISEDIVPGIRVAHFESVIPTDPETQLIQTATIQTIPLLPDPIFNIKRSFAAATQMSLSFLREADKKAKLSKNGVLLAVDSGLWIPRSDKALISIIDPCGLRGHVLLFVRASCQHALLSTEDNMTTISVDETAKPLKTRTQRANLLLEALFESNKTSLMSLSDQAYEVTANVITE